MESLFFGMAAGVVSAAAFIWLAGIARSRNRKSASLSNASGLKASAEADDWMQNPDWWRLNR
jgi:hypothetical protein